MNEVRLELRPARSSCAPWSGGALLRLAATVVYLEIENICFSDVNGRFE